MTAECSSCGAAILWAQTIKGHRIPLDRERAQHDGEKRGLFALIAAQTGAPLAVSLGTLEADLRAAAAAYRSHFATCPNAAQHRRTR